METQRKIKHGSWLGVSFMMKEDRGGFYNIEGVIHHKRVYVSTISEETFANLDNNTRTYDDIRRKRRALRYCYRALNREYKRKLQLV